MIPAARRMTLLLYPEIETPISRAKTIVNAIKTGSATFLKVSTQQPMKQDIAMSNTDNMMIIGMLTKTFVNTGLL